MSMAPTEMKVLLMSVARFGYNFKLFTSEVRRLTTMVRSLGDKLAPPVN